MLPLLNAVLAKNMTTTISILSLLLLSFVVFLTTLVEVTTCTQGSLDVWLVSLFVFVPAIVGFSSLALIGRARRTFIRWFTLPVLLALPLSSYHVVRYIIGINLKGEHPCSIATGTDFESFPLEPWVPYWAPIHFAALVFCSWVVIQFWVGKRKS